ncbi:phosphoenolpyruvate synthase [Sedimentibacter hydroxybenzoicus DSM 7310]|uniref:Rifampicin phosphotransferase n=1 Tax=Sedimentibacter hydroxybenzoicus DSM 7310 TaxID=1123245 RepID=A0A974BI43_SEDHY|nr:phosphoenolpyruvate synthase [Sedimentibacter hydroxybenzoicus]NYB73232.1 phosphoenolpyruvate synthase [Sedimentibacter hydroxybenzoicus DSM 7310]
MEKYLIGLKNKEAQSISVSGGKGANLARLHGINDIPVPDGFVVTAQCYAEIVTAVPEVQRLLDTLSEISEEQTDTIKQLSIQIKKIIENITFPSSFINKLDKKLSDYGISFSYAVRSSATAEDLPGASFAGQQDTFLNVRGTVDICNAIAKCWASLFNERAIAYRIKNGFEHDKVTIAVVVQKMVISEVSGVMFTADPMTSDRFTTVIEAVRGLGEELVSGRKNPFEWKLRNGKLQKTSDGEGGAPINEARLLELTAIGKHIETAFDCEQDIEWCYADEKFYIVQARPITTLFPPPQSPDGYKHCAISVGHLQMMTDTVLPLGISMLQKSNFFSVKELGGHMFMDITYDIAKSGGRMRVLSEARIKDPLMHEALKKIFDRKEYLRSIPDGPKGLTTVVDRWGVLTGAFKIYHRNNESDIDSYIERQNAEIEAVRGKLEKLSGADIIKFIINEQEHFRKVLYDPAGAGTTLMAMMVGHSVDKSVERLTGEKAITNRLSKSVRHNVTSEMGLKLCEISDVTRNYPQIVAYLEKAGENLSLDKLRQVEGGAEVADKLEKFLSEYGMRCTGEIDITRERFRERPGQLSTALINNIKNLPTGHAITAFSQGKEEAEQLAAELVSKMEGAHGRCKAQKLRKQIEIYRNFIGVREYTKYFWMCHYDVYKQAIMREVQRLVNDKVLNEASDAYYLSLEELMEVIKSKKADVSIIYERRKAYQSYQALTPPRIIFSDGEVPPVSYSSNIPDRALAGLAVSSGIIEGRARVVESLSDAHIEKGDILVTIFTDPSWTPVFVSLSGLVTEVGGMMSHGAVITREYGMPAVVGVVGATKQIKDGQRIRLNGTEGYIEILEDN